MQDDANKLIQKARHLQNRSFKLQLKALKIQVKDEKIFESDNPEETTTTTKKYPNIINSNESEKKLCKCDCNFPIL